MRTGTYMSKTRKSNFRLKAWTVSYKLSNPSSYGGNRYVAVQLVCWVRIVCEERPETDGVVRIRVTNGYVRDE